MLSYKKLADKSKNRTHIDIIIQPPKKDNDTTIFTDF